MTIKNIDEWQLFHLAQALTRAKRLEKHREDFHEELYECITVPNVAIDPLLQRESSATDTQAIRIIEAKERYDNLVQEEYSRYVRWKGLLKWVDNHDQQILIRYFQKKKHIQPKIINRLLMKIEKQLNKEERRIENEREEQSTKDFRKYQEATRAFRKPVSSVVKVETDKQRYIISGQFVYMTPEEYANH